MAFYFSNFPTTEYSVNGQALEVTNITKRFAFVEDVMKNKYAYYYYDVQDGERPDAVAYKMYENASIDWIILMTNRIVDPYFQWPLSYREFVEFMNKKYGNIDDARTMDKAFYKIVQHSTVLFDGTVVPEKRIEIDSYMYNTTVAEDRYKISVYDYEYELNEKRRHIKIIDKAYVPQILREFGEIFNNG